MTNRLKNSTYNTKPLKGEGEEFLERGALPPSLTLLPLPLAREWGQEDRLKKSP
jgi:hypothetical protein